MATKTTKTPKSTATKAKSTTAAKATSAGRRRSTKTAATTATTGTRTRAAKPATVAKSKPTAAAEAKPKLTAVVAPAAEAKAKAQDDDRVRRPDIIEAVAARVSVKRSDVKMVMDVFLDELGKALDGADDVVVPPLGKLMVKKRAEQGGNRMLTLKLKRADEAPDAGDVTPLAKSGAGV